MSTSILSKKSLPCIKGYSFNKIKIQLSITKSTSKNEPEAEEAIVIDMFQNTIRKSHGLKQTYTIRHRDDKRLNREGVLRVYNFNEPIDIPVTRLLGRWKSSHVGVTLVLINERWHAEGKVVEETDYKQATANLLMFQRLFKKCVM